MRLDPVDALVALGVAAVGTAAVKVVVDDGVTWWAPGVVGAVVGLGVALFAPRSAPPVPSAVALPPPPVDATQPVARVTGLGADPLIARVPVARRSDAGISDEDEDATVVKRRSAPERFETSRFAVRSLTLPKLGNEQHENEDGLFVLPDVSRIAVADGASSAFASRQWSQILTEGFATRPDVDLADAADRAAFVEQSARRWQAAVSGASDWWSNDARDRGSFAALVGVSISDDLTVVADAVGDCCLFVVDRAKRLRLAFPLDSAEAFDSTPSLLATNAPDQGDWVRATGRMTAGDTLVLASDAVAQWLLADATRLPWLIEAEQSEWAEALVAAREEHVMVNDDVTVVTVTCKGA